MRNYHVIIAGFALQRARTLQTPVVCNRTGIPAWLGACADSVYQALFSPPIRKIARVRGYSCLIPRLHPLQCILARERAWLLISCERSLTSKWINEHGLYKPHTHDIWCTRLLPTAVCWFNSLTLAVMEAQLNLLCLNTTCTPEECLAKLKSQAALQNYF